MGKLFYDHRYDDIVAMERPESLRHAPMSRAVRAAQFAPFAALTGYEDAVAETARLTGRRIGLSEEEQAILNQKLMLLAEHAPERPEAAIVWFREDPHKAGGEYVITTGKVRRVDEYEVILTDGGRIPLALIDDIRGEMFRFMEE